MTASARPLKVVEISTSTSRSIGFVIEDPTGELIDFEPGQFLTFLVDVNGAVHRRAYAEAYAERYGFPFPTVADTSGDLLYYFDAASTPGNVMIDATEMRIFRVIQGWDQRSIEGVLNVLDGSVNCR